MRERDRLAKLSEPVLQAKRKRLAPARQRMAVSGGDWYSRRLVWAGISCPAYLYVLACLVFGTAVWVLGAPLGHFFSVAAGMVVTVLLAYDLPLERAVARKRRVTANLPRFIEDLAGRVTSGVALDSALVEATRELPAGDLKAAFEDITASLQRGASVYETLTSIRLRVFGVEARTAISALRLFVGHSAVLPNSLVTVATVLRRHQQEVEVASQRLTVFRQIFSVAWLCVVIGVAARTNPEIHQLLLKIFGDGGATTLTPSWFAREQSMFVRELGATIIACMLLGVVRLTSLRILETTYES